MSAHTPGPWVANGSAIEDRPKRGPTTVIAYGVEAAADAHLLAAAPDLLAVLKECLESEERRRRHLEDGSPASTYSDVRLARVRAAIAKAEGR